MPESNRLSEFYEERYGFEANAATADVFPLVAHPVDRIEGAISALAARTSGKDVLELGSGSGAIAQSLVHAGVDFRSWFLTDLSPSRVEGTRARLGEDPRFRFDALDVSQITTALDGELFDVVVNVALIEHLIDPMQSMADIRTLLRPGGFVYIDTPNIAKWTRRIKLALGRFPSTASQQEGLVTYDGEPASLHDEGHLHYFTFGSLERMLIERCGYSRVERVPYGSVHRLPPKVSYQLARWQPTLMSDVAILAFA